MNVGNIIIWRPNYYKLNIFQGYVCKILQKKFILFENYLFVEWINLSFCKQRSWIRQRDCQSIIV